MVCPGLQGLSWVRGGLSGVRGCVSDGFGWGELTVLTAWGAGVLLNLAPDAGGLARVKIWILRCLVTPS